MAVSGPEQSYTFSDIKVVKSGRAENVTVTVTAKMYTINKNFGNELNFNLYKNRRLVHTLTGTASQAVQDGSYSGYYNISFNFPSYEASHSSGHEDGIIVNDIVWFELTDYVEQSVDDICGFYFKATNSTGEANINEGLTKDTNSQIYYDPSLPSCSGCGLNFTDGAYVNGAYSYDSTFNVGLMTDASADYKIGVIATTIDYSSGSPKPGKEIGYILGFDGQAFELDFKLFDLSLTELYIRAANNRPYRTCGIKSGRYMMFGIAYYRLEDMKPVWGKPAWDANATEVMCEYSKELALNNGGAIIPEVQPHETTTVSLSVHTTLSFPKDLLYDLPYKLSLIISDNPTLGETYQYPSVEKTFDIIEALGSMYMQLVSSIYSIEEVKDLGEYNTVSNDIISTFDASEILYSDIEGFDENAIYYAGYKVTSSSGGVWYFNNDNALQLNATPPVTVEEDVVNVNNFEFNPTPSYLEAKIEGEVIKRNEGGLTLAWSFYDKTTQSSLKTVVKDLEDYSPLILRETLDISTLENDVYGHTINVFCAIQNKLTEQTTVLTPQTEESDFVVPTSEYFDFKGPVDSYFENFNVLNSVYIKSISLTMRKLLASSASKYIKNAIYSFEITQGEDPLNDEAILQVVHYKDSIMPTTEEKFTLNYQDNKKNGVLDVYTDNNVTEGKTIQYNYFLEWGETYKLGYRIIFRYLGITKIFSKPFQNDFYILNNVSFTNGYYVSGEHSESENEYKVEDGYLKFRHGKMSFYGLSNPNNEEISALYIDDTFSIREIGATSSSYYTKHNEFDVSGYDYTKTSKQTFPVIDNKSEFVPAFYAYTKGKHYLLVGGNKYPQEKLNSLLSTNIGEGTVRRYNCQINSCSFNNGINIDSLTCKMGDNSLPIGQLSLLLEIAKDNKFTTITHTQRKNLTALGTLDNFFDIIETDESDVGTNYLRITLETEDSELYYKMFNVTSSIMQLDVPLMSKINTFTASLNSERKILVDVTGTNTLYVDLYRHSDDTEPYKTYTAMSGEQLQLDESEPGTTWYIRARSVNGDDVAILTETDEDGNEHEVEYQITIPYTETVNYDTVADPTLTADKLQLDNTANLTFNFEEIETNVDHVQYDIEMYTTNYPIDPLRFENVEQSLFNHTFESRLDDEVLSYELNVTLYNSFNDIVKKYVIKSNEVTLDSVDLDEPSIPSDLNTTYHSILYTLSAVNSQGWKLYRLTYELKSDPDKKLIKKYEFGDEEPTLQSEELTIPEDKDVLFENLKPKTTYWVIINAYFVNPIDLSKRKTKQQSFWGETRQFSAPAVNIHTMNITNQINNKPTVYSNFELSWGFNSFTIQSEKPTGYTVEYKKGNDSEYTRFNTQDKFYTLNPEMLDLHVNDEIYIRIGTIYYNKYVDETYISYYEFDKITVAETSYEYYRCSYPDLEIHQRKMYKMLNGEPTERMIRDIYMNK